MRDIFHVTNMVLESRAAVVHSSHHGATRKHQRHAIRPIRNPKPANDHASMISLQPSISHGAHATFRYDLRRDTSLQGAETHEHQRTNRRMQLHRTCTPRHTDAHTHTHTRTHTRTEEHFSCLPHPQKKERKWTSPAYDRRLTTACHNCRRVPLPPLASRIPRLR